MKKLSITICVLMVTVVLFTLRFSKEEEIIANGEQRVVLDAGHGGHDVGGSNGATNEKDVSLEIVLQMKELLEEAGINVITTRDKDVALGANESEDLRQRVSIANQAEATLFVSIHTNATPQQNADGFELYTNKKGKAFANSMEKALDSLAYTTNRGVFTNSELYVLRQTDMASVLVEVGFIDGPEDAAKLESKEIREAIAKKLAQSIIAEMKA